VAAVIHITDTLPSLACVSANAHALARYAALCQEQHLVPIVEPEVLMGGSHTIERCEEVSAVVLQAVFHALFATANLNAINRLPGSKPWKVSFSYGRALQDPALEAWHGHDWNLAVGQRAFRHRAHCNGAASAGQYTDEMDAEASSTEDARIAVTGATTDLSIRSSTIRD
jgi:fructose-bisphosphate aldolase class I